MEDPRFPTPRQKLKIPIVGKRLQTIQMQKLIQSYHVPIMDGNPN